MKKSPTAWLRADLRGRPIGVDRDAKVINGFVVAQEGPFKSEGRGEFDKNALSAIVGLMAGSAAGLKSRFTHPTMSADGLGKFLGRARNGRLDQVTVLRDGAPVTLACVRADLHLSETAFRTPSGDLGTYVMDLAESDPDALSSSLVLQREEEYRRNADGTLLCDDAGEPLPPLWRPTRLHASDVVDTGDAVDGFLAAGLSAENLPDAAHRKGAELLNQVLAGMDRREVRTRCLAWLDRYLDLRFGPEPHGDPDLLRRKLELRAKECGVVLPPDGAPK